MNVPFEKLSKKKKREENAKQRNLWPINPVTKKPKKSGAYDRNKEKAKPIDE